MNRLENNIYDYLPLNRKERFYTGTVLPQIICGDNFRNLHLFFELIPGFPQTVEIKPDASSNNILFFTEYSLKESLVEDHHKSKFSGNYETKDTPDGIILITSPEILLVVIEAKMYSNASAEKINEQLRNQKWIIDELVAIHSIPKDNVFHVAITPSGMVRHKAALDSPLIYWEDILDKYQPLLKNNYFYETLRIAIDKFDGLKSQSQGGGLTYGKNMDERVQGRIIVELHNSGKKFMVGRGGGISGDKLKTDIATGGWKSFEYEVNYTHTAPINDNWFTSEQFVRAVQKYTAPVPVEEKKEIRKKSFLDRFFKTEELPVTPKSDQPPYHPDPWHFSHLGIEYFDNIARKFGAKALKEAKIDRLYIGSSGEAYEKKRFGRNVNPNWAVEMTDGSKYKCRANRNQPLEEGLWTKSNCLVFDWSDIVEWFE